MMDIVFQNTGNMYTIPRGYVSIRNPHGEEVGKGIINSESQRVFPQKTRKISFVMKTFSHMFLPGWYTASLHTRYDGMDDFTVQDIKIFVFPWQSAAVLLAVFILCLVFFRKKKVRLQNS